MKQLALSLVAAGWVCVPALPARAHHSYWIFYDLCTTVTVEGQIETVQWQEPHVLVTLKTDDGTPYLAEWTSLRTLARQAVQGPAAESLTPGTRVAVTGSPMRDRADFRLPPGALKPSPVFDPALKVVSALTQVRAASGAWSWSREQWQLPEECTKR
jgi:hypothetical protein